jgi:hypothetical protein
MYQHRSPCQCLTRSHLKSPAIAISSNPPTLTNTVICRYTYTCEFRSSLPRWFHSDVCVHGFSPSIVMGKHHQPSDGGPPNKASAQPSRPTSSTSSLLKALYRGRGSNAPQPAPNPAPPASENHPTPTPSPSPIQQLAHDAAPKPARPARIPAVTSKAMTTAPVKDKSRPHRRKYPT